METCFVSEMSKKCEKRMGMKKQFMGQTAQDGRPNSLIVFKRMRASGPSQDYMSETVRPIFY